MIIIFVALIHTFHIAGALLRPIDADLQRRKKMILKRMEEDKRIGVQTCIILQRLIEQKRQDRAISSGSLNNAIITRDNQFIREKDLRGHKLFNRYMFVKKWMPIVMLIKRLIWFLALFSEVSRVRSTLPDLAENHTSDYKACSILFSFFESPVLASNPWQMNCKWKKIVML